MRSGAYCVRPFRVFITPPARCPVVGRATSFDFPRSVLARQSPCRADCQSVLPNLLESNSVIRYHDDSFLPTTFQISITVNQSNIQKARRHLEGRRSRDEGRDRGRRALSRLRPQRDPFWHARPVDYFPADFVTSRSPVDPHAATGACRAGWNPSSAACSISRRTISVRPVCRRKRHRTSPTWPVKSSMARWTCGRLGVFRTNGLWRDSPK